VQTNAVEDGLLAGWVRRTGSSVASFSTPDGARGLSALVEQFNDLEIDRVDLLAPVLNVHTQLLRRGRRMLPGRRDVGTTRSINSSACYRGEMEESQR